jgi:hypothetical protein
MLKIVNPASPAKPAKNNASDRELFISMLKTLEILTERTTVEVSARGNSVLIKFGFAHMREFQLKWTNGTHFAVQNPLSASLSEASLHTVRDVRDFISGRLVDANIRANQKNKRV